MGEKRLVLSLTSPHLFRFAAMVNLVALSAVVLPLFLLTGGASVPEDTVPVSGKLHLDLNSGFQKNGKVAAAWWAGWHPDLLPLDKVSWKKYTHMTYAFA